MFQEARFSVATAFVGRTDAGAQSIVSVFGWWDARCWVSPERWFGSTLHITLFGVGGSGRSPVSPPTSGSGGGRSSRGGVGKKGLC